MTRHWLHNTADVAAAIAENPPDLVGWELIGRGEHMPGTSYVVLAYEDDEGAVAWIGLTVTRVELDERRVKPEPPEREKGDEL